MGERYEKPIKITKEQEDKSIENVVNSDYVIVDGEPFFYDDAVLDSIDFDDIYSIDAEETYRELVMLDRLMVEAEKSKKELKEHYMQNLINEHLNEEKEFLDSLTEEIEMKNNNDKEIENILFHYDENMNDDL